MENSVEKKKNKKRAQIKWDRFLDKNKSKG